MRFLKIAISRREKELDLLNCSSQSVDVVRAGQF